MLGRFTSRRSPVPEIPIPELPQAPAPVIDNPPLVPAAEPPAPPPNTLLTDKLLDAKVRLHRRLIEEINLSALEKLPDDEMRRYVHSLVSQYTLGERLALNTQEL